MVTETLNTEQQDPLIDRLQAMLEMQVDMVRQSNFHGVEKSLQQTRLLVTEIEEKGLFRKPSFRVRHEDITKLYQKLNLMLAAGKEDISQELRKVGKGKKMIRAYRHGS